MSSPVQIARQRGYQEGLSVAAQIVRDAFRCDAGERGGVFNGKVDLAKWGRELSDEILASSRTECGPGEPAAHTPGPWTATPYSDVLGSVVTAQPDSARDTFNVAMVGGDQERSEANASLIAAAPDLLDVVKALLKPFEGRSSSDVHVWNTSFESIRALLTNARAAITKAEARA